MGPKSPYDTLIIWDFLYSFAFSIFNRLSDTVSLLNSASPMFYCVILYQYADLIHTHALYSIFC